MLFIKVWFIFLLRIPLEDAPPGRRPCHSSSRTLLPSLPSIARLLKPLPSDELTPGVPAAHATERLPSPKANNKDAKPSREDTKEKKDRGAMSPCYQRSPREQADATELFRQHAAPAGTTLPPKPLRCGQAPRPPRAFHESQERTVDTTLYQSSILHALRLDSALLGTSSVRPQHLRRTTSNPRKVDEGELAQRARPLP